MCPMHFSLGNIVLHVFFIHRIHQKWLKILYRIDLNWSTVLSLSLVFSSTIGRSLPILKPFDFAFEDEDLYVSWCVVGENSIFDIPLCFGIVAIKGLSQHARYLYSSVFSRQKVRNIVMLSRLKNLPSRAKSDIHRMWWHLSPPLSIVMVWVPDKT